MNRLSISILCHSYASTLIVLEMLMNSMKYIVRTFEMAWLGYPFRYVFVCLLVYVLDACKCLYETAVAESMLSNRICLPNFTSVLHCECM